MSNLTFSSRVKDLTNQEYFVTYTRVGYELFMLDIINNEYEYNFHGKDKHDLIRKAIEYCVGIK